MSGGLFDRTYYATNWRLWADRSIKNLMVSVRDLVSQASNIVQSLGSSTDKVISQAVVTEALGKKQTVFTGICQEQYLTENDIVIDNTALTLTIATVKNGQAISASNPICFYTDGNGVATQYKIAAPVVFPFTDTTGVWYFYFNSLGAPISTQVLWSDFSTIATVFRFYWNAALPAADKCVIQSVGMSSTNVQAALQELYTLITAP